MAQSPATQLLARHAEAMAGTAILLVDSPAGEAAPLLRATNPESSLTVVQSNYGDFLQAQSAQIEGGERTRLTFAADIPDAETPGGYDLAVVYLPQGRLRREMILSLVAHRMTPGGRLLLVGPLRGGIRSAGKTMERLFGQTAKLDSARHCGLLSAKNFVGASPWPIALAGWRESFTWTIGGGAVPVVSYPGVFSHGRLDVGTRLLLETIRVPQNGTMLDFGCGCGVIGAFLRNRAPRATVHWADVSALALAAARETAAANGGAEDWVFPSDIFTSLPGPYTAIVSNPPFHSGVQTDYAVVELFLRQAASRLTTDGRLTIVANRFLKYQPLLKSAVGSTTVLADDGKYRVYESSPSR